MPAPTITYWHLWSDESGISHFTECQLENFDFKGVGNADPQWNNKQKPCDSKVVFTVQPVGWVGEWHENPAPQWIIPISGHWWVEAMDGTRREFGPGDLQLGEDQSCTNLNGKSGHRSGTIGDQPAVLMCIQLATAPIHSPGHFK
jgi:hypothetical protein